MTDFITDIEGKFEKFKGKSPKERLKIILDETIKDRDDLEKRIDQLNIKIEERQAYYNIPRNKFKDITDLEGFIKEKMIALNVLLEKNLMVGQLKQVYK